jgi:putative ATP-dependent endonuclease of the OLD family
MKLAEVRIKHYRSCRDVRITLANMHALVGANNAGKSSILRALDFFFNPSTRQIDEEAFWNKDPSQPIRVEGLFVELTDHEKEKLAAYLRPDDSFLVAREATLVEEPGEDGAPSETKTVITQQCSKPVPKVEWLRDASITGKAITEWWSNKETLVANGQNFAEFVGGTKPTVGDWKAKAQEFAEEHLTPEDYEEEWLDNPKGYAGVLKASLPLFVLVPAVRDVSEESKVGKTNPFGRLVYAVMDAVTAERRTQLEELLSDIARQLNRDGGDDRIAGVKEMESKLNESLRQIFTACDLEIEFQTPTFEVLMTSPRIYVDDGFRTLIDNKGHGLQRAAIFSILRSYADFIASVNPENKRTLVFAVEEPELYMHPMAQRTIRRVFAEIADGGDQVLFSTHSSLLVEVAHFDEIIRTEGVVTLLDGKKTVSTRTWQLPAQALVDDEVARHPALEGKVTTASIRDHYSNAYNPSRNEGFFAKRILLVEGQTEEYALPIYAEAVGKALDELGVAVVECGGKCSMDRHFRIFNELGIPCYLLMDYDKSNDDQNIVAKSRELLALMGQDTDAPEGFAAFERIACFEEKWETTQRAAVADYEALHADATAHLGPAGKPLVERYLARRLTTEDPPRVPEHIRAIIDRALAVEWNDTCLVQVANEE